MSARDLLFVLFALILIAMIFGRTYVPFVVTGPVGLIILILLIVVLVRG